MQQNTIKKSSRHDVEGAPPPLVQATVEVFNTIRKFQNDDMLARPVQKALASERFGMATNVSDGDILKLLKGSKVVGSSTAQIPSEACEPAKKGKDDMVLDTEAAATVTKTNATSEIGGSSTSGAGEAVSLN